MRNYKKYRVRVIDLFQSFIIGDINKNDLMENLNDINSELTKGKVTDKEVWFKFYNNDTLATTLRNIYLSKNDELKEQMQIAINNPKGLQIYFS